MTTIFKAKYPGQCVWCLEPIEVDQDACYWRKKLYHAVCKKEAYAEAEKKLDEKLGGAK